MSDFQSVDELFEKVPRGQFYETSANYWEDIPSTYDGVLGGYGYLSTTDINSSRALLLSTMKKHRPQWKKKTGTALDCGAGVGRITRHLLGPLFAKVDLVEPCKKFCDAARASCANELGSSFGEVFQVGLQDFDFSRQYDVVWIQWVLNYLTQEDLAKFLLKVRANGPSMVFIKENAMLPSDEPSSRKKTKRKRSSDDIFDYDAVDSSITRSDAQFRRMFADAGMKLLKATRMKEMPDHLFPVMQYVLECD